MHAVFTAVAFCAAATAVASAGQPLPMQPCATGSRLGAPACGAGGRSAAVSLEPMLVENFEQGISWTRTGAVDWYLQDPASGDHSVRLSDGGAVTKAVPLPNRGSAVVTFEIGATGLDQPSEILEVAYQGDDGWITLIRITGDRGLEPAPVPHAFLIPTLEGADGFALRFRMIGAGPADFATIDEVAVWAPRVVPPPAGP